MTVKNFERNGKSGGIGTDFPYSLLSGNDAVPDVSLGRIPVDSLTEAFWVVDKIISYESMPSGNPSYFTNAAFAAMFQGTAAGVETRGYLETVENIVVDLIADGYSCDRIYAKDVTNPVTLLSGAFVPANLDTSVFDWSGDVHDIVPAINSGRFLVTHRDHGDYDSWYMPSFPFHFLDSLTNTEYPVVFSINCQTGWFDNELFPHSDFTADRLCFAEGMPRRPNAGCAGIIAATRNSPTFDNNALTDDLFEAIWPAAGTGVSALGQILNTAKIASNNTTENYLFHVLGDPTMELWTANPSAMDVFHNSVAWTGDSVLQFEVSEDNAQIILVADGTIIAREVTSVPFDTTIVDLGGPLDTSLIIEVGVTKDGFRPYRSRITVLPSFVTVPNCGGEQQNSGLAVATAVINNAADVSLDDSIETTSCAQVSALAQSLWSPNATPLIPENLQFLLEHYTGDGVIDDSVTIDPTAIGGQYNWTLFQNENLDSMLYDIAYWQYAVGLGTPVPLKGDYRHWVTIIASTASYPLNNRDGVTIKGFWVDDPSASAGMSKYFITTKEWSNPAFGLYMPTSGDAYEAIIEPPSTRGTVDFLISQPEDDPSFVVADAARRGIDEFSLKQNSEFNAAFANTSAGYPLCVHRTDGAQDYYLQPFVTHSGNVSVIVRISSIGEFLSATYSSTGSLQYPEDPSHPQVNVYEWHRDSERSPYDPHMVAVIYNPAVHKNIRPTLETVVNNCDGTWSATFGYHNKNSMTIQVPIGAYNSCSDIAQTALPTLFEPGRHSHAFQIRFSDRKGFWKVTAVKTIAARGAM